MKEIFKDIKDYKGDYQVSTWGNIRSLKKTCGVKRKTLSNVNHKNGYPQVNLCNDGKQKTQWVHRLVALTFIPNPENKPQVNHKDGDKSNNNLSNLEWVTPKENMKHAVKNKLSPRGVRCGATKLTNQQVEKIKRELASYKRGLVTKIAKRYKLNHKVISDIKTGRTWSWL